MKTKISQKVIISLMLIISIQACRRNEDNIVKLENGKLKIIPYTERSARILFIPDGDTYQLKENLTITKIPEKIKVNRKEEGDIITLSWGVLKFTVDKTTGQIRYYRLDELLFSDTRKGSFSFEKTMLDNAPLYKIEKRYNIPRDQGLYGLGQYLDGVMNYQDHEALIVQANEISVNPMLVSTAGWGILWDNYSKTYYKNHDGLTSFSSEYAAAISYYVIAGKNMDDVVKGYRELTGDAPLFGKWAYGYWQSKERYKSFDELKDVVREYRRRKIPIDNIVQDWKYWGENSQWSALQFDSLTYPDPERNINDLHDLNVHLMVSIWPGLGSETEVFKEMEGKGYLYGDFWGNKGAKMYDAYTKEARDIYWKYIKENLLAKGVDALWMDGTEPEFSRTNDQEITEAEIIKCTSPTVGPLDRYLNTYSLMTTTGTYEGQRALPDNKRVFTLTRSAFTGQQRNAAVTWSGDVAANWEVLHAHIAAGMNFSLSGIPYWTHDIGAFFPGVRGGNYPGGVKDPGYRELYTRWFQFGAFSPVFRSHGTHTPREIWRFGEEGEMFYDAMKKISELRYRLMPYIYSTAWRVTSEGFSIMRSIPMSFPGDKNSYDINDQYLFGESVLVKPVTHPMYYNCKSSNNKKIDTEKTVEVYLPEGVSWYNFWTGDIYQGGKTITASAPIDVIPLFVKAGSIIPLGPSIQYADEKLPEEMNLIIYPGGNATFNLYEDDGSTYAYENGEFSVINFDWKDTEKTLVIHKRKGTYSEMLNAREFILTIAGPDMGGPVPPVGGRKVEYKGEEISVTW